MQYDVVYDAAALPFRFPREALFGLLPLAGGALILRFPGTWFDRAPRFGRLFGGLVTAFGLAILAGLPIMTWLWQANIRRRLTTGEYIVVEGTVSDFTAGRADCHPMERFRVAPFTFSYCPSDHSGFNQVSTQGGPIHAGLHVRIANVDGNIQRLEIRR